MAPSPPGSRGPRGGVLVRCAHGSCGNVRYGAPESRSPRPSRTAASPQTVHDAYAWRPNLDSSTGSAGPSAPPLLHGRHSRGPTSCGSSTTSVPTPCAAARVVGVPVVEVLQGDFHPDGPGFTWWLPPEPAPTPVETFNGRRTARLGAGSCFVSEGRAGKRSLEPSVVATGLRQLLTDAGYRRNVKRAGDDLAALPGAIAVVDWAAIEQAQIDTASDTSADAR